MQKIAIAWSSFSTVALSTVLPVILKLLHAMIVAGTLHLIKLRSISDRRITAKDYPDYYFRFLRCLICDLADYVLGYG